MKSFSVQFLLISPKTSYQYQEVEKGSSFLLQRFVPVGSGKLCMWNDAGSVWNDQHYNNYRSTAIGLVFFQKSIK